MKGFLRLFPLNCVIFPNEVIHLHIFEPRYIQLIQEVEASNDEFGIPFFQTNVKPFGTRMSLQEIKRRYPDGKKDVVARGIDPFEILQFVPKVENKLYPGGQIKTLPVSLEFENSRKVYLVDLLNQFFNHLDIRPKNLNESAPDFSFQIGHNLGFSLEQEFELLLTQTEFERQEMIISHLENMIPSLEQAQFARKRIQQNGFFRSFDALDLS